MKNIFRLLFYAYLFGFGDVFAQQVPLMTHYYRNKFLYNPAQAANLSHSRVDIMYRQQWAGQEGSPQTMLVTGQFLLKSNPDLPDSVGRFAKFLENIKQNVSIGGLAYRETLGLFEKTGLQMTAAKFFEKNDARISVGLTLGMAFRGLNTSQVIGDLTDPRLANFRNQLHFDGTLSFLYAKKGFEIGYALHELFQRGTSLDLDNFLVKYLNHSILTMSYSFQTNIDKAGFDDLIVEPQLVYRLGNIMPGQVDFNIVAEWARLKYTRAWAAVGYRTSFGAIASAGYNVSPQLGFSYNYEYSVGSELATLAPNGHEIMLTYHFGKPKKFPQLPRKVKENTFTDNTKPTDEETGGVDVAKSLVFEGREYKAGEIVTLGDVRFVGESAELTDESYDALDKIAELLLKNANARVEIGSHTANPVAEFARTLTQSRAMAVADYLDSKGVPKDRTAPIGYANTRPNPATGRLDERIDMKILEIE